MTTTDMMRFCCGHSGSIPPRMGRGAARQRRLSDYFAHRCPDCQRAYYASYAAKLTWADGSAMSVDSQTRWVARRMAQMPY